MVATAPERCPLCVELPAEANLFIKGGEVISTTPWPVREDELRVVGRPVFDDSTSHSGWCLKLCPHCATVYAWEMEYEFLVNGSEDDISLRRLDGDGHFADVQILVRGLRARTDDDPAPTAPRVLASTRHDRRPQRRPTMEALRAIARLTPAQLDAELERVGAARASSARWCSFETQGGADENVVFGHRRPPATEIRIPTLAMTDLDLVSLRGLDLHGADLCGAAQHGGDAGFVDLRGAYGFLAHFEDTCFDGASLRDADFSDATLVRCSFVGADLRGCDFERAYVEDCDFFAANLDGSNLDLDTCVVSAPVR